MIRTPAEASRTGFSSVTLPHDVSSQNFLAAPDFSEGILLKPEEIIPVGT
jgi:hypothetical protein